MTTVALVDDHELLRTGLAAIVNTFVGYKVIFEASNGKEFIASLKTKPSPDIILLDITMPVMDGYETAAWIKLNLPDTKVLVLSMLENEGAIIRMIKNGARGYILKDSNPKVFRTAMNNIRDTGYFINELVSNKLMHYVNQDDGGEMQVMPIQNLSDNELCFLKLICTDKTYKEIADDMSLSPRTIDTYRDNLFKKLQIKTRTGLAIFAIRNGLIDM
jgi:DNA-binding NarL/FixJ family response regulator